MKCLANNFVILKSHEFRKKNSVTNLQHTLSARSSTGRTFKLYCFRFLLMFFYKKHVSFVFIIDIKDIVSMDCITILLISYYD